MEKLSNADESTFTPERKKIRSWRQQHEETRARLLSKRRQDQTASELVPSSQQVEDSSVVSGSLRESSCEPDQAPLQSNPDSIDTLISTTGSSSEHLLLASYTDSKCIDATNSADISCSRIEASLGGRGDGNPNNNMAKPTIVPLPESVGDVRNINSEQPETVDVQTLSQSLSPSEVRAEDLQTTELSQTMPERQEPTKTKDKPVVKSDKPPMSLTNKAYKPTSRTDRTVHSVEKDSNNRYRTKGDTVSGSHKGRNAYSGSRGTISSSYHASGGTRNSSSFTGYGSSSKRESTTDIKEPKHEQSKEPVKESQSKSTPIQEPDVSSTTKQPSKAPTPPAEVVAPPEKLPPTEEELAALAEQEEETRRESERIQKEQDKEFVLAYVSQLEKKYTERAATRARNAKLKRPDETWFSKLESNLKKNTAFVRKLKNFTSNMMPAVFEELQLLNLTKYVSEMATALVEAKLKMSDVDVAVQLCCILHHLYAEFAGHLLDNWQKVLTIKKDDKNINQSKLRVDLRFYAECINAGVLTNKEGLPTLGNVLTVLMNMDKEEHNNINIILNFCRHCGDDFAGLVPTKVRKLSEEFNIPVPRSELLPKEKQKNVRTVLKDYYVSISKHLVKAHQELQAFERQNKKILQTKGELSADRKAKGEKLEATFQRLKTGVLSFSEQLDEEPPDLPEEPIKVEDSGLVKVGNSESEDGISSSALWEDEEMQRFYEQLPNMKEYVPSLIEKASIELQGQVSEETLDAPLELEDDVQEDKKDELIPQGFEDLEDSEPASNTSNKILLEAFLVNLPHCVNREMIDTLAVDFVMKLNTKFNRKKLTKTLFLVPRIRLDLLPFYARLVAILYPVVPEIASDLGMLLKHDFKYHVKKKDQINIESKIKTVRFIGELVKFRMYTKIDALFCLKMLLHDFSHHHIEMCCNLLEGCGRFLFRHPDSHQRTKVYLEQMMRKKAVMALDSRYVTMIENAFYYVNPPEGNAIAKKERPPLHTFLRKLLYNDLTKPNTDKILRIIRKFDWDNPELAAYVVKCLTYAYNVKYYNIRCLANLLAGLVPYQDFVGPHVVDGVLEDIRLGLEMNQVKYNQRRVAMVRYLGELYNYRLVESADIFKVLYSMISFGVGTDHNIESLLDPPENLLRIRLVCVLLDTCGQYFSSGISKKKLDYFFIFFQNYYWFKRSDPYWNPENKFPLYMEYMFKDTLKSLRPQINFFTDYEESQKAVADLHEQLMIAQPDVYKLEPMEGAINSNPSSLMETIDEQDDELSQTDAEEAEQSSCAEEVDHRGELEEDEDSSEKEGNMPSDDDSDVAQGELGKDEDYIASPRSVVHVECAEDNDFMSAFDRMVSDNIYDRMRETVKPQQVDISVPLHIKSSSKKTYEQLQEIKKDENAPNMNFILMVRKGNKQQYKNLSVPVDSELALNLKNREEAERLEKERVKRLTLDINERLEEEDYQEMLSQSQRPAVMNLNRERRPKYNHPRGAPDADLIFGSKKAR